MTDRRKMSQPSKAELCRQLAAAANEIIRLRTPWWRRLLAWWRGR